MNELKFIYDLYEYNDQSDGVFTLDFEVEGKGNIPGMSYTTTGAASLSPTWVLNAQDAIVSGLNWADGDRRYLRWNLSTSDTELFDEIAIDNIRVAAIPEPSTYALIFGGFAVGLVVFVKRRRDSKGSI
ncbi:MAG: PEP-CTERM sorting domain-containing protein [Opitutales bacterium]|nr:PEP-CTERM sorting domain-containing protein [Opitutales bacterium]